MKLNFVPPLILYWGKNKRRDPEQVANTGGVSGVVGKAFQECQRRSVEITSGLWAGPGKKKSINLRNIYLQVEVTRTKNNNNKESEYKKHAKIIKYNMVHNVFLLPFFFFKCV